MKLGVFGGTFDPVHVGHLMVAEDARVELGLDTVLFITAGEPWLKDGWPLSAAHHRVEMVRRAVLDNPGFRESSMEVDRPGPSYSVDTLEALREGLAGDGDLFLLVGLDALRELTQWHRPERIFELSTVVGIARPGAEKIDRDALDPIDLQAGQDVVILDKLLVNVSSSDIRSRVSAGQSIRYLVPETVEEYISEHGLYGRGAGQ